MATIQISDKDLKRFEFLKNLGGRSEEGTMRHILDVYDDADRAAQEAEGCDVPATYTPPDPKPEPATAPKAVKRTRDYSKFQPNSGVYTCAICGKKTRDTGNGEESCEMCLSCYNAEGLRNEHNDSGHPEPVGGCPVCTPEA